MYLLQLHSTDTPPLPPLLPTPPSVTSVAKDAADGTRPSIVPNAGGDATDAVTPPLPPLLPTPPSATSVAKDAADGTHPSIEPNAGGGATDAGVTAPPRSFWDVLLTPAPPGQMVHPTPKFNPPASACFRCLAPDHFVVQCRDPVRCRRCGASGHMERWCKSLRASPHRDTTRPRCPFTSCVPAPAAPLTTPPLLPAPSSDLPPPTPFSSPPNRLSAFRPIHPPASTTTDMPALLPPARCLEVHCHNSPSRSAVVTVVDNAATGSDRSPLPLLRRRASRLHLPLRLPSCSTSALTAWSQRMPPLRRWTPTVLPSRRVLRCRRTSTPTATSCGCLQQSWSGLTGSPTPSSMMMVMSTPPLRTSTLPCSSLLLLFLPHVPLL